MTLFSDCTINSLVETFMALMRNASVESIGEKIIEKGVMKRARKKLDYIMKLRFIIILNKCCEAL